MKNKRKTEPGNKGTDSVGKGMESAGKQGIVVRIGNRQALVLTEGREEACLLAGFGENGKEAAEVGDQVVIEPAGGQQYKLAEIRPRKTELYRGNRRQGNGRQENKKTGGEERIRIAVNGDCLLAMVSAEYLLHQAGYPEMAILAARRAGMGAGFAIDQIQIAHLHIVKFVTTTLCFQQHSETGIFLDVDVCDGVHHDAELDHYSSPLAQIAKSYL